MDKKDKKASLDFLTDKFGRSDSVVFTSYRGLSAQEMSNIKQLARDGNGEFKVVKNTIVLKAMEKNISQEAQQFVDGPCAVAFLPQDPISLLKILVGFSKEHQALILRGGLIEGELVKEDDLKKIAALPSKTELLTSVVSDLNAPVTKLVNYLYQIIFGLVSVINSIKNSSDKNQSV